MGQQRKYGGMLVVAILFALETVTWPQIAQAATQLSGSGCNTNGASATGDCGTAVGYYAIAWVDNSTAIGGRSNAQSNDATAVGHDALAVCDGATAIGGVSRAYAHYSISIGESLVGSYADQGIAIGRGAQALAENTVAIGGNGILSNSGTATESGDVAGGGGGKRRGSKWSDGIRGIIYCNRGFFQFIW
jgi:trimeric autotransporter adhesin